MMSFPYKKIYTDFVAALLPYGRIKITTNSVCIWCYVRLIYGGTLDNGVPVYLYTLGLIQEETYLIDIAASS